MKKQDLQKQINIKEPEHLFKELLLEELKKSNEALKVREAKFLDALLEKDLNYRNQNLKYFVVFVIGIVLSLIFSK